MLTVEEALAEVMKEARPLPPAERSLLDSRGCLLAENVAADADQPPFDKSLVDGYAVRISDLTSTNRRLKIGETILAGQTPTRRLGPCEAAVIMTGAPLPPEADAAVMHEHTRIVHEDVVVDAPERTSRPEYPSPGADLPPGRAPAAIWKPIVPDQPGTACLGRADPRAGHPQADAGHLADRR